ncbi:Two-component response regulator ORR6 [Rhynchospora pubera]|uniref:Two-component response regulator ORR6 n=1 Tax=Rhynchospora pubera TaxID=906938 RepID=A0AAV8E888_9POAL|nr:Two-component response regulator ORR6 [Rhynchospora pubera]
MGSGDCELHVLEVDDSSVDHAVIARILRNSKYRAKICFSSCTTKLSFIYLNFSLKALVFACIAVTAVDSAERALEVLEMEPNVNMIITDYCMPEMNGYELLRRVEVSA